MTALAAHLLFVAANGGLAQATALPDTFGTAAFVAVAAAADLPPAFAAHMAAVHGETLLGSVACTKVFDIFR